MVFLMAIEHPRYVKQTETPCAREKTLITSLILPTSHGITPKGSTVISRYMYGITPVPPHDVEVPNRAVDVNSRAR